MSIFRTTHTIGTKASDGKPGNASRVFKNNFSSYEQNSNAFINNLITHSSSILCSSLSFPIDSNLVSNGKNGLNGRNGEDSSSSTSGMDGEDIDITIQRVYSTNSIEENVSLEGQPNHKSSSSCIINSNDIAGGPGGPRGFGGANDSNIQSNTDINNDKSNNSNIMRVYGTIGKLNKSQRNINQYFNINETFLIFNAVGGAGGDGGCGQNGEKGREGEPGQNATQCKNASNGGGGGDGGDAGRGSNGSNGGKGGNITIRVSYADMDLLMLIKSVYNQGGSGGKIGKHGHEGSGGEGGYGGAAYRWETEEMKPGLVLDEKTKEMIHGLVNCKNIHEHPSGNRGNRGRTGRSCLEKLAAGETGTKGIISYIVDQEVYSDIYKLVVDHFDIQSDEIHGIFEPGSIGFVKNIRLKNIGAMPTPPISSSLFHLYIPDQGKWIQCADQTGEPILSVIHPGQYFQLSSNTSLLFKIKPAIKDRLSENPLSESEDISLLLFVPNLNLHLDSFSSSLSSLSNRSLFRHNFIVQYPFKLDHLSPDSTTSRIGQTLDFKFSIHNNSNQLFNNVIEMGEIRNLSYQIDICNKNASISNSLNSSVSLESLKKLDNQNNNVKENHLFSRGTYQNRIFKFLEDEKNENEDQNEIRNELKTKTNQYRLLWKNDIPPFTKVRVSVSLCLSPKGEQKEYTPTRIIQKSYFDVNLIYGFQRSAELDEDILLVTTWETNPKKFGDWTHFFQSFGLKFSVWDIDDQKHFNWIPRRNYEDANTNNSDNKEQLIMSEWYGKCVVMLNSSQKILNNTTISNQIPQAVRESNIRWCWINDSKLISDNLKRRIIERLPTSYSFTHVLHSF